MKYLLYFMVKQMGLPLTVVIIVVLCVGGGLLFPNLFSTDSTNNNSTVDTTNEDNSGIGTIALVGFGAITLYQIRNYL
jgi:hypothetical protein